MAKSISRYLADISSTSGVLDGTLSTAAQTNITSLGTLSSLTVSGSAAMTLTTAAQPNITSVGTLSSLSTSGNISTASGALAVGQSTFSGGGILADFHGSGNAVGAQLAFANDHNTDKFYVGLEGNTTGDGFLYQEKDADINFYTNDTFRVKIDNSGNVGIGTTSPDSIFHVKTASGVHRSRFESGNSHSLVRLIAGTSSNAGMEFYSGTGNVGNITADSSSNLLFEPGGVEKVRIDSSGKVGIGTNFSGGNASSIMTAPLNIKLTSGSSAAVATFNLEHSNQSANIEQRLQFNTGDDGTADSYSNAGYIAFGKENTYVTDDTRDSYLSFATATNAVQAERMRISSTGATTITGPAAATLTLKSTDDAASTPGPHLILRRDAANPANGDDVGEITWIGKNNAAEDVTLAVIRGWNTTVTDGAERSSLGIYDKQSNSGITGVLFADSSSIHLNHSGVDRPIQFRGTGSIYSRIASHSYGMSFETTTSDGSDNLSVSLDGGSGAGSNARGAWFGCYGNENSSHGGSIVAQLGTSGDYKVYGGSGADKIFHLNGTGAAGLEMTASRFIVGAAYNTSTLYNTGSVNGIGIYGANAYSSCGAHIETATDADSGWAPFYVNKFDWTSGDDARWMSFAVNGYNTDYATINYDGTNFAIVNASDYRLKENIVDYSGGLAKLEELKVRTYNKKEGVSKHITQQGFIAHEAATANIPGFISGEKDAMKVDETGETVPDYQVVNKEALIPYLVSAIQELSAKVKELESK